MFKKLFGSFDNTSQGYSGRKLTAWFSIMVAAYVTYTLPLDVRLYALYAWLAMGLLCLGIITFEQILKFKSGQPGSTKETETTIKETIKE